MKSDLMEGHCTFGLSGEFLQAASRTLDPTVMQEIADVLRIGSLALVAKILSFFVKFPPPPPPQGNRGAKPPPGFSEGAGSPQGSEGGLGDGSYPNDHI